MNRIFIVALGDFASFFISFLLLIFIRFEQINYQSAIDSHFLPFTILYLSWVMIFYIFGLYDLVNIKPTIPYIKRWILALMSSFFIGLLFFYFIPIFGISPKINLIIQVGLFGFFSFIFRRVIYTLFSKTITQKTILIGESSYLLELKNIIKTNPQIGLFVIDHFSNINELDLDKIKIKNILIILDKEKSIKEDKLLQLFTNSAYIVDTAKAYEKYLFKIPVAYIDMPFIVDNINIKTDPLYKSVVLFIDKIFSIIIITLTSPFLLISAICIYLYDKGPVLYIQERVGLDNKVFKLYKLRSMNKDSEKDGAVWSSGTSDKRVTPIGKIIRKTHIDEIPQMINILKGDLSLVGPRPERPQFVSMLEETIPHYKLRHIIKPGFTGWAQIKYRYANTIEDSKEKFEYDLYYIKNKNIFLDIGIIIRTIQIIFTH